jgi:flagellar export protein FliJ
MSEIRSKIQRLARIVGIRQIAVDQAEARVRQAEVEVGRYQDRLRIEEGKIRQAMEQFAQPGLKSGIDLKQSDAAAGAGEIRALRIRQDIEKAELRLNERRAEWTEARREQKTVEKLRERKLHKAVREEETLMQKVMDEIAITRYRQGSDPTSGQVR